MFSHLRYENNGIITGNTEVNTQIIFSCFKVWHDSQVEPNTHHSLRRSELY